MSLAYEELASHALQQLGATTALSKLDHIAQQAAAEAWSYSHFLGRLLEPELAERRRRVIETNLRFAGLPYLKRIEDFDFAFQPSIDKVLVEELATGRFLADGRNVILLGPPGVGKTHLAISLGILTAELGQRLFFLSAMELARRLAAAFTQNRLPHAMKKCLPNPGCSSSMKSATWAWIPPLLPCSSRSSATDMRKTLPSLSPPTNPSRNGLISLPAIPSWPVPHLIASCIAPRSLTSKAKAFVYVKNAKPDSSPQTHQQPQKPPPLKST